MCCVQVLGNMSRKTSTLEPGYVYFVDDGGVRIGQLVATRFFGRIGGFHKAFLNPTMTMQRCGPGLITEQFGNVLGGYLSRSLKQRQGAAWPGVEVAQHPGTDPCRLFQPRVEPGRVPSRRTLPYPR
jgi:hypothetical protein